MIKTIEIDKLGEVIFRPMRFEDVKKVHNVESKCYNYPWSEKLIYDCVAVGYFCWLVEHKKKIIGYAIYRISVGEAHLFNIAISPKYQGKGLARKFLSFLLEQMQSRQAENVILEVRVSNTTARNIYKEFNFQEIGIRKDYYPDKNNTREDAINLELKFEKK